VCNCDDQSQIHIYNFYLSSCHIKQFSFECQVVSFAHSTLGYCLTKTCANFSSNQM